jgi:hypothetical protein
MRPHWVFASIALLVAAPLAHADEVSKAQKVEEYFQVARLEQMFSQSMTMTMNQVKSSVMKTVLGDLKLSPEQQTLLAEFQGEIEKVLMGSMSWDHLRPEYIQLFSAEFTEEQLDDILAFYKSPTGQVMVDKTPLLMQKGGEIVQQRMTAVQPEIRRVMEEFSQKVRPQ